MKVAMVGLGKLGLPVAYALGSREIEVFGHDPAVWNRPTSLAEAGLLDAMGASGDRVRFVELVDAVNNTDGVVFVAVQTPHDSQFEGVTSLGFERADFDYTHLVKAVRQIVSVADALDKDVTLAVISTVLPGTLERDIVPLLSDRVRLVYNPSFIAMGTTVQDFLDPEFVLLGGDRLGTVRAVYDEAYHWPAKVVETTVRNAELIKVAYNTFIGLKIVFANTLMEVAHKTGCDVDQVTGALKLAHRRLISPAYMDGGMGDGGGCHPRDNIALSWLADELGLSHDLFGDVMLCREHQARWLGHELVRKADAHNLPIGILGLAYKPGSHITTGSTAVLVKNMLEEDGETVTVGDPHVPGYQLPDLCVHPPHVWLVGCKHREFVDLTLPEGSIVIDPFRYIPDQEGVTVVRVGQASGGRRGVSAPTVRAGTVGERAA